MVTLHDSEAHSAAERDLPKGLTWGTLESAGEAAALMEAAWRGSRDTPLEYTPRFFQDHLDYPGPLQVIAPALYDGNKLAGFVMGLPRGVRVGGASRRFALLTFFTVAPEWQGKGLGTALWAECLSRAQQAGYDGAVYYCTESNKSNAITAAGVRRFGAEPYKLTTVNFLARGLSSPTGGGDAAAPWPESSIDAFLEAAWPVAEKTPLTRLWTQAEAEWQCHRREGAISVTHRSAEGGAAALAGYRVTLGDSLTTRCVLIEDVLWDKVGEADRSRLLANFLQLASEDGQMAIVPVLNCSDLSPFIAARFRRSPRVMNVYAAVWNGNLGDVNVSSIYMDVI